MADADILISAGTGTKVDTRTVGAGTDEHRQVMVVGDPVTAANVATVDASNRLATAVADGANVGLGALADAIVAAGGTGSLSAKLRRATQGLEDLKTLVVLAAGENHVGAIGGHAALVAASQFTRPANVTAYASGDLVANSVTAGSVVALSFVVARVAAGSGMVRRARIKTSSTVLTNAQFRLHLYTTTPTVTNGDNGVWLSTQAATYIGAIDTTVDQAFSDGATGLGAPLAGSEINFALASGQTIYGLLEVRAAYTPTSAETFDVALECLRD